MKHIIILGDGMADHPVERLGGKTLLQYADKPYMDMLARKGRTGRLITVPEGSPSGATSSRSKTARLSPTTEATWRRKMPTS